MKKTFTLIEVTLAAALLSVGMIGVLAAYAKAADTLRIAQNHLEATSLLARQMAQVEEENRRQAALPRGRSEGTFSDPYADFKWTLEISAGPFAHLDRAVLTVEHETSGRTYSLATLFPNEKNALSPTPSGK